MNYNYGMGNKLAENLKGLMDREGVSQAEMSKRTRIPATSIYRLTSGETANPTLDTLQALARYFGVGIGELVGERPIPGLDTGYKGDFAIPFPRSMAIARLVRTISERDQAGTLPDDLAASLTAVLMTAVPHQ